MTSQGDKTLEHNGIAGKLRGVIVTKPPNDSASACPLVGSGSGAWGGLVPALVSTPCRIKPCMRCSLTRLSDNLLPGACAIPDRTLAKPPATDFGREYTVVDPLAPGIAFAGVAVICGAGGIGPLGACTVTYLPALAWLKQGSFPPTGLCCPDDQRYL